MRRIQGMAGGDDLGRWFFAQYERATKTQQRELRFRSRGDDDWAPLQILLLERRRAHLVVVLMDSSEQLLPWAVQVPLCFRSAKTDEIMTQFQVRLESGLYVLPLSGNDQLRLIG